MTGKLASSFSMPSKSSIAKSSSWHSSEKLLRAVDNCCCHVSTLFFTLALMASFPFKNNWGERRKRKLLFQRINKIFDIGSHLYRHSIAQCYTDSFDVPQDGLKTELVSARILTEF